MWNAGSSECLHIPLRRVKEAHGLGIRHVEALHTAVKMQLWVTCTFASEQFLCVFNLGIDTEPLSFPTQWKADCIYVFFFVGRLFVFVLFLSCLGMGLVLQLADLGIVFSAFSPLIRLIWPFFSKFSEPLYYPNEAKQEEHHKVKTGQARMAFIFKLIRNVWDIFNGCLLARNYVHTSEQTEQYLAISKCLV